MIGTFGSTPPIGFGICTFGSSGPHHLPATVPWPHITEPNRPSIIRTKVFSTNFSGTNHARLPRLEELRRQDTEVAR